MNMKFLKNTFIACILALSFLTNVANAALIDNGEFTTDTATGLEWLDLTETTGITVAETAQFIGSVGYYQVANRNAYFCISISYCDPNAFTNDFYVGAQQNIGTFLVRDSNRSSDIPEPTTVFLFGLGLIGVASRRIKGK